MGDVQIEGHDAVAVIRLTRGVTNALGQGLVGELAEALAEVKARGFGGLVLAGNEKFFSIGIDLPELLELDRDALAEYWRGFNSLCLDLYTLPIPTITAIEGHAIAGGTILALTTDYRLITSGRKRLGLNEVRLGLPIPYLPALIVRQLAGDRAAIEVVYRGELLDPDQARALGLIDEVCPEGEVEPRAIARLEELAALPGAAFAAIKATRVEAVRERYLRNVAAKTEELLDLWFTQQTRALMLQAAEKF